MRKLIAEWVSSLLTIDDRKNGVPTKMTNKAWIPPEHTGDQAAAETVGFSFKRHDNHLFHPIGPSQQRYEEKSDFIRLRSK